MPLNPEWNPVEQQLESLRALVKDLRSEVRELRVEDAELRRENAELREQVSVLRCDVGYRKSMHARTLERNAKLQAEPDEAKAEIRQIRAGRQDDIVNSCTRGSRQGNIREHQLAVSEVFQSPAKYSIAVPKLVRKFVRETAAWPWEQSSRGFRSLRKESRLLSAALSVRKRRGRIQTHSRHTPSQITANEHDVHCGHDDPL